MTVTVRDDLDATLDKMELQANSGRAHVLAALFQFVGQSVSAKQVAKTVGMLPAYGKRRPRRPCTEKDVMLPMTIRYIENRLMEPNPPCHYRLIIDQPNKMLLLVFAEDEEKWRKQLPVPYTDYFANFTEEPQAKRRFRHGLPNED